MSGCPMVVFRVGGVDQVVEEGVTGVVIDGHDPAEMAGAVAALLDDDGERAAMGLRARAESGRYRASAPRRSTSVDSVRRSAPHRERCLTHRQENQHARRSWDTFVTTVSEILGGRPR